ncbi:hypothetical protein AVEN_19866-1 [Araneus ventricosus]|uniref:Ubiquitin-like domain-containing protein n=1 Tax=Araneus ventricosus TaxID=182803 RepID=A0A4Y2PF72_ARAVE|nr:hypothetical protein AVEN_87052-1 [Araneus ventricosus]GBN48679.1 hypothetical protein AVEN_19866-1 [Araneus ventricosus]
MCALPANCLLPSSWLLEIFLVSLQAKRKCGQGSPPGRKLIPIYWSKSYSYLRCYLGTPKSLWPVGDATLPFYHESLTRGFGITINCHRQWPEANPPDCLHAIVTEPTTITDLKASIATASDMPQKVWQELHSKLDVCRVRMGEHIEPL